MNQTALYAFYDEYASFLEEMEAVQKEKLESLLSKDLARMERSIKSQQAYAMRLDNIELRRIRMQEEAGFPGLSFSEVIDQASTEHKDALRQVYLRVKNAVTNIKYINQKATEVAEVNLRSTGSAEPVNQGGFRMETKI